MNPATYLTPILGAYQLNIQRNGSSLPVYFILQRNIQDFDIRCLEEDDLTFNFDIKGQVSGRKVLDNPRELLNFEVVMSDKLKYKQALKDQDFL